MKVVITVSKTFFPQHPKEEQKTGFNEKIICGQCEHKLIDECVECSVGSGVYYELVKIHTCRANYEYWKKKIEKLKAEGGVLSVRQWSLAPYRSPQEIIVDIPAENVGVQKLNITHVRDYYEVIVDGKESIANFNLLANNDGLSSHDFEAWFAPKFKKSDVFEGAIIHFTKFRY
jgi:hypothetical protein